MNQYWKLSSISVGFCFFLLKPCSHTGSFHRVQLLFLFGVPVFLLTCLYHFRWFLAGVPAIIFFFFSEHLFSFSFFLCYFGASVLISFCLCFWLPEQLFSYSLFWVFSEHLFSYRFVCVFCCRSSCSHIVCSGFFRSICSLIVFFCCFFGESVLISFYSVFFLVTAASVLIYFLIWSSRPRYWYYQYYNIYNTGITSIIIFTIPEMPVL